MGKKCTWGKKRSGRGKKRWGGNHNGHGKYFIDYKFVKAQVQHFFDVWI